MNSDYLTNKGLKNGRQWTATVNEGGPLEWSIDADNGLIQGPLDLVSMRGQKMSLIIEPNQMAFLLDNGQLLAVYLDGAHFLEVGKTEHQINPEAQLIFVALDAPLAGCNVHIERPTLFFNTFLLGQESTDPKFVVRLMEQMIRGVFEKGGAGQTVSVETMNETLTACGLCCTQVASPELSLVPAIKEPVGVH